MIAEITTWPQAFATSVGFFAVMMVLCCMLTGRWPFEKD